VKIILELCAFGLEDSATGQNIYFFQRWEEELGGIPEQICGNGVGGLEEYNVSSPREVSDKGLGGPERPGQQSVVEAMGRCLSWRLRIMGFIGGGGGSLCCVWGGICC